MLRIRLNASTLERRLTRLERRLKNLRPFFETHGRRVIYNEIERVFETEGDGTWPPLSPGYASFKRRVRPGKGLLRFDDAYFRAATSESGEGSVFIAGQRSVTVGVDTSTFFGAYPEAHEEGRGRLPARPVFDIARENVVTPLVAALTDYLFEGQPE